MRTTLRTVLLALVAVFAAGALSAAPAFASGKPFVETKPATNIGETTATLNGVVNPNGAATKYYFEYGTTTSYGSKTTEVSAGSGETNIKVSQAITGLKTNTTYHFRVVATNVNGTTDGSDEVFTAEPHEWFIEKAKVFAKVTTPVKVEWEYNWEVDRTDYELGLPYAVACAGTTEAEIKSGGEGSISRFISGTVETCKPGKATKNLCVDVEEYRGANYPWTTTLYKEGSGSELRQKITASPSLPEMTFKCDLEPLGRGYPLNCDVNTNTHMTNSPIGLVEAKFDTKSNTTECEGGQNIPSEESVWTGVIKIKPTAEEKEKGVEAIKVE
jgi:hypothetical protein